MDRSQQLWVSHGKRDDHENKLYPRNPEFNEAEVAKKQRQLGGLQEDVERLRAKRKKLRAEIDTKSSELDRKSAECAEVERFSRDAKERQMKRIRTMLNIFFAEVLDAPTSANGSASTSQSDDKDEAAAYPTEGVGSRADAAPAQLPTEQSPGEAASAP